MTSAPMRVTLPLFAGLAVAGSVLGMPGAWLHAMVAATGLPGWLPAATAPIGATGRLLLGGALGVTIAAVTLMVTIAAVTMRGRPRQAAPRDTDTPVLRRADAHPDAPSRRPIRAHADLGAPMPIELPTPLRQADLARAVPRDLDQPLSAFDPESLPAMPREPLRALPSLAPARSAIIDPGERFETFELTPVARPATDTRAQPAASASIGDLLDRLERGTRRQPATPDLSRVDETLTMLRAMASGR